MDWHSKEGVVLIAQVDHLTGEQIGYSIGRLYQAGASNVQVLSAVTKKNRPSWVFMIDCREEHSESVEAVIPQELGVGGWHRISTEHHFLYSRILERQLRVRAEKDEKGMEWTIQGKMFENGNLRPEHESVIGLQEAIYHCYGEYVSYSRLYHVMQECLEGTEEENWVFSLSENRLKNAEVA